LDVLVNIDVPDLPKSEDFYCRAFGLVVSRRLGDSAVELHGAPAPIFLLAKGECTAPANSTLQTRTYRRHWTPVHLDVVVDNIEESVDLAVGAGAYLEEPGQTQKWGKLALMSDPFGNGFCFVQFLGRGYDELIDPQ
jgi:catechol 2,3-dioxygenase-like lactoylglutathione lyase family enzyme